MVGVKEDVSEIKGTVAAFDHRVSMLEDVRVKAIEEREIRRDAIADERARAVDAARAAAERANDVAVRTSETKLGKQQFWIGTILIVAAGLLGALIASGHLF
jgi:hypothetical protein